MDHKGIFIARNVQLPCFAGCARVLSASIALWALVLSPAFAATEVQGTADDLQLTVDNATLIEVLNALSSRFKLSYKLRSHNPRTLTGHYSGTLRATITRILDGNDYFLELTDNGLEIIVLGTSEQHSTPQRQFAGAPAAAPAISPTASPPPQVAAPASSVTPAPSVASPRPLSPSIPATSASAVPPLSSFAVLPPVTP